MAARRRADRRIFGSDVAFRMVDFASATRERAGVARGRAVPRRRRPAAHAAGGRRRPRDAAEPAGYGERIEAGGIAGPGRGGRERAQMEPEGRRLLHPAGLALEEELRRLDGLGAVARRSSSCPRACG
jgi:hypothetical protein